METYTADGAAKQMRDLFWQNEYNRERKRQKILGWLGFILLLLAIGIAAWLIGGCGDPAMHGASLGVITGDGQCFFTNLKGQQVGPRWPARNGTMCFTADMPRAAETKLKQGKFSEAGVKMSGCVVNGCRCEPAPDGWTQVICGEGTP